AQTVVAARLEREVEPKFHPDSYGYRPGRSALAEANAWLVRGVLLGGERALAEAVPADWARVEVRWTSLMGVRHPGAVSWTDPVRSPEEPTPPNTALAHAERAYRAAVRAAAEHAAHRAAAELLSAEAERTRRRVRALRRHWIPRLRGELAAVELALEESEHEEAVRRRWAAARGARQHRRARSGPADGGMDSVRCRA
ncbi:V-type ATP synthase subunit D, partial [Streptomyces sp. NPDC002671]